MDERVEAFLADVLALAGEEANAIRQGVRGALADYEQLFRAQEVNKRMKEKAAHACHALCRARVVEEIRLRKGTRTAEHLKLVLSVIDGPRLYPWESRWSRFRGFCLFGLLFSSDARAPRSNPLHQPIASLLRAVRINLPATPCIWASLYLPLA